MGLLNALVTAVDFYLGDDTRSTTGMGISESLRGISVSEPGKRFSISMTCNKEDETHTEYFSGVNSSSVSLNCKCCGSLLTISTPGNGKDGSSYCPDSFHRVTYSNIEMVR